jgi:glycosyltransferase involved in cell wall biosynthesis
MYLRPGLRGLLGLGAQLRQADENTVVYLNSFFSRRHSILAILMRSLGLCRPRCFVVAPRGEFSPGALGLKRIRKSVYIGLSRRLGLYKKLLWHASSPFEAHDIHRQFPLAKNIGVASALSGMLPAEPKRRSSEVAVASDIAARPSPQARPLRSPKQRGHLRAVFVSRLTRMKNAEAAIAMLEGIAGEVCFDIYGPVEDEGYWKECQCLIAKLPPNIRVRYRGEARHEDVAGIFAGHDLLLLPTRGENFGHVICEALASGCPVLISDRTPWRNLEAAGVGWDLPLNEPERFQAVLRQCVDSGDAWYSALSRRAVAYAGEHGSAAEIVDANRRLFQRAVNWANA